MFIEFEDKRGKEHIVNTDHIVSATENSIYMSDGFEIVVDDEVFGSILEHINPTPCGYTRGYSEEEYRMLMDDIKPKDRINLFTSNLMWYSIIRDRIKADIGEESYQRLVYHYAVK